MLRFRSLNVLQYRLSPSASSNGHTSTGFRHARIRSASSLMKAAVYHSFGGKISIENIPIPQASRGGVVLEVKATGVCRSDWHGWKGHDSDIADHGLPFVPGHELSGVIAEIGEDVEKFAVGDRVAVPFILSCGSCRECLRLKPTVCEKQQQPGFTTHGSFAQYVALPRADRNLCHLPESVSHVAAAALGCRMTTAFRAVIQQGQTKQGDTLAIFGCGGLGMSCLLVGVAHGARVIAVDTNPDTMARATQLGAAECIDGSLPKDEILQRVLDLTDGVGADVTVDAAGFQSTCENAVWCARRAGRVVQVGLPLGIEPVIPMARVAGWELEIIGSHGMAAIDFPHVLQLVANGRLAPEALVEREVDLATGAAAIEAMDGGSPMGITMVTSFP